MDGLLKQFGDVQPLAQMLFAKMPAMNTLGAWRDALSKKVIRNKKGAADFQALRHALQMLAAFTACTTSNTERALSTQCSLLTKQRSMNERLEGAELALAYRAVDGNEELINRARALYIKMFGHARKSCWNRSGVGRKMGPKAVH